jgi:putative membrane protein
MKNILSDYDRDQLNLRIAETEKCTNAQIVLAVIKRSDSYAELPWKAFALGASVTSLLFFILNLLIKYWISHTTVLIAAALPLFVGALFALLTVFIPGFAKLFLATHRAEVEVLQYAESLFLERELFATNKRTGILLLISLFERQVLLLPDKGIRNSLTIDEKRNVITSMTLLLKRNEVSKAFEVGLKQISLILEARTNGGLAIRDKNELPNEIIEEKGV